MQLKYFGILIILLPCIPGTEDPYFKILRKHPNEVSCTKIRKHNEHLLERRSIALSQQSILDIVTLANSTDIQTKLQGVQRARRLLSSNQEPPIDSLITVDILI